MKNVDDSVNCTSKASCEGNLVHVAEMFCVCTKWSSKDGVLEV